MKHPLFVSARGVPITPNVFKLMVRKVLSRLGVANPMRYSAKSFRVGAASEAFSLGFSFEDFKGLGRRNSDAFMEYILSGARAKRARRVKPRGLSGVPDPVGRPLSPRE